MVDLHQPIVYSLPGMPGVRVHTDIVFARAGDRDLALDVYLPSGGDGPWPVVLFVHGNADPETLRGVRGWGQYTSWGRLAATTGFAAVVAEHRSTAEAAVDELIGEVAAALRWCRGEGRAHGLDADRLAVFGVSAGVPFALAAMAEDRGEICCAVCFYGLFRMHAGRDGDEAYATLASLSADPHAFPPLLVVRAGLDQPRLNATVDEFAAEALTANLPFELINHPGGRHGFDVLDDTDESRHVIARTVHYLHTRLTAG